MRNGGGQRRFPPCAGTAKEVQVLGTDTILVLEKTGRMGREVVIIKFSSRGVV